jgi:membrane protein implicated in regulation of membrane protease activity
MHPFVGTIMKLTTLCVPMEVQPESCSRLSSIIDAIRVREDKEHRIPANFARLREQVPVLHFMSLSVFTSAEYDPMFILEANFDGEAGPFWGQLESLLAQDMRAIVRCCKRPLDETGPLYDAIVASGSRVPVAQYYEARTQQPSVFHHGNRGLSRDRILSEAALFDAVRTELDAVRAPSDSYRTLAPSNFQTRLRQQMLPLHPWLGTPVAERITGRERSLDKLRFVAFAVAALFVLSLPGFVLALLLPPGAYLIVIAMLAATAFYLYRRMRDPLPGTGVPTAFSFPSFLRSNLPMIAGYVATALLILVPVAMLVSYLLSLIGGGAPMTLGQAARTLGLALLLGLVSLLVVIPALVLWIRFLERRDSSHDAPPVDECLLREMIRREDWVAQNHMGSIVLIKPGVLRTIVIRAGHLGLGLLLRVTATDGYLGTMRTVHFAHWAFLNNRSRLLFFSNFDHSWGSYLDDFIEKAHVGLTLAWGCGIGFPPTRFLVYDGASHGRRFKNWALASRAVSRFWYSAYPTLTVDQIERNYRIASGLRQKQMSDREARAWMRDL